MIDFLFQSLLKTLDIIQGNTRHNPRSYWKVARKSITAISFSPDAIHFAISSKDGTLKVIDYDKETYLMLSTDYWMFTGLILGDCLRLPGLPTDDILSQVFYMNSRRPRFDTKTKVVKYYARNGFGQKVV